MTRLPTRQQNPDGLHQKYLIQRADGKPVNPNARYFVLRIDLDHDPEHAIASRHAAYLWADYILSANDHKLRQTALDLIEWLNETSQGIEKGGEV